MTVTTHFYKSYEARADLPASLMRGIGRVIVKWAYVEHKTQQIVRTLAQLTIPMSRVVMREPRLEDRIDIIAQLAEFLDIQVSRGALKSLKTGAKLIAAKRHAIAHGFWTKEQGQWCLGITRGEWCDEEAPTRYKSILPENVPVSASDLAIILDGIDTLSRLLDIIARQVGQRLQAPPELHPSQFPRKNPKPNRGKSGRSQQRQSTPQEARRAKKLSAAQRRKMALGRANKPQPGK